MRLSNRQQCAVDGIELHDDGIVQRGARNAIAQYNPTRPIAAFSTRSVGDVDRLVAGVARFRERADREDRGIIAQNPPPPPRWILRAAQRDEQQRAKRDPRRVEPEKPPSHASYDTGR